MTEVSINKQARLSEHLTSSSVAALGHSSELDGSHLTPHFTLAEMCKTSAKTPDGNIPSHVHIENLRRLCSWLEMLRDEWNRRYGEGDDPIIIKSGFFITFPRMLFSAFSLLPQSIVSLVRRGGSP